MVEREYIPETNRTIAERRYFYDANGIISSAKVYYYGYNGNTCTEFDFFFKTNIQGDVLAVYNASGTEVMKITYDAWGNFTDTVNNSSSVPTTEQLQALAIPFRYRGYVYDQETGFYYLNSRYYDPSMHRFINADSTSYLGVGDELQSFNLYSYCGNNPVMGYDPMGTWDWGDVLVAAGIVVLVAAIAVATVYTGGAALVACGAVASMSSVVSVAVATGATAVVAGAFNVIDQTQEKSQEEDLDMIEVGISTTAGATRGFCSSIMKSSPVIYTLLADATIGACEGVTKAINNDATLRETWNAAQTGFANSFIAYGVGVGAGHIIGAEKIFPKITSSEIFNGFMNLGSRY